MRVELLLICYFLLLFRFMADVEILSPVSPPSLAVSLSAHVFEMFIQGRYALAFAAGAFITIT